MTEGARAESNPPPQRGLFQRAFYTAAFILSVALTLVALMILALLMGATKLDRILVLEMVLLVTPWAGFGALRSGRYLLAAVAYVLAGLACLPLGGALAYFLLPAAGIAVGAVVLSARNRADVQSGKP